MSRLTLMAAVLVMAASAGACGRSGGAFDHGSLQPVSGAVAVRVVNNSFRLVDVYVVGDGVSSRMGTVAPTTTNDFVLDPSFLPAGDLRLVATPVGGNGRASSGRLVVSAGQTIEFDIAPRLRDSVAIVH